MGDVHNISLSLLDFLTDEAVGSHDLMLAAVALTLVRLANPMDRLSAVEETNRTKDTISFVQMIGGVKN